MTEQRLVFASAVEGLFGKALQGKLTPALADELRRAGLDVSAPWLPAYPYEVWEGWVGTVARVLLPEQTPQQAHRTLGEWFIDGYFDTVMGRALKQVVRVLGAKRTLGRMRHNFRSGNNFAESQMTELGPTHVQVRLNELRLLGHLSHGILYRGLWVTQPKTLAVDVVREDADGFTYDVRWT